MIAYPLAGLTVVQTISASLKIKRDDRLRQRG